MMYTGMVCMLNEAQRMRQILTNVLSAQWSHSKYKH